MNKWIKLAFWLVMAPHGVMASEATNKAVNDVRPALSAQMPSSSPNKLHSMPSKVAVCMGCHGIPNYRIAFPQVYRVPALSGQNAQYIETALHQYKNGQRKMQTMQAIVSSLSERDMAEISTYYAQTTLSPAAQAVSKNANILQGRALIERNNCASCHGADFNHPISPDYPRLAGQYADYLYYAMRAYQQGTASSVSIPPSVTLTGRDHAVMQVQLQSLSDADLRDMAAYLESLPGQMKSEP